MLVLKTVLGIYPQIRDKENSPMLGVIDSTNINNSIENIYERDESTKDKQNE